MIEVTLLSVLQGVAEFLPISSSGHLVLGKQLLGLRDVGLRLDVFLHLGTLIAVFAFYFSVIRRIVVNCEWPYLLKIVVSAVPVGVVGLLFHARLEEIFSSPRMVGVALIFTGFILTATRFLPKGRLDVSFGRSFWMGLAQAIAILPGVSRSGMTIAAARIARVDAEKSAEFSFLMSAPPIAGAALLEVLSGAGAATEASAEVSWPLTVYGCLVAAFVGYFSLRLLLKSLKSRWFWLFGPYCLLVGVLATSSVATAGTRIAVHPQAFDAGGWKLDVQFMDEMGSPMLLAHGAGVPVGDARATVTVPEAGDWRVRVRSRNWADGKPGAFQVRLGGTTLKKTFGVSQRTWAWEDGGTVTLAKGETTVALRDLTGFEGRCAGILLEKGDGLPPFEGALSVADEKPAETIETSFCVVGGGLPGCAAALAAARSGVKTVLVNDRPYLGGNASREIRIWCAGEGFAQPIIRSLRGYFYNGDGGAWTGDDRRLALLSREENIDLRLSTRAFGVTKTDDGRIASVRAIDWKRNRVIEIKADLFLDATGDGWIGAYAGADWRMGREAKGETGESMAPEQADGDTLGASLVWSSRRGTADVPFSAPWAEPHAQGVVAVEGDWNWEYGIHRNMVTDAEGIRDRLFLAIYGSFSLAKKDPANARNVLDNVPFLLGKRESRRLMGDHVFCERDVVERIPHADAIAKCSWPIDLHFDDAKPGIDFQTRCTSGMHGRSYVPFRSIYSRNVANLMMAGRCFSCTHVGLGSPRVINTLAQMGVAAGYAAMICGREGILPRELGKRGFVREIQRLMGGDWPGNPDPAHAKWAFVDDEDKSVRFGKGWIAQFMPNGEQFGEQAHVLSQKAREGAGSAVYPLPVAKKGRYRLHAKSPFQPWPMDKAAGEAVFEIESEGKTTEVRFNQYLDQGTWRAVGDFDLAPGATLTIEPAKSTSQSDLFADGFALESI